MQRYIFLSMQRILKSGLYSLDLQILDSTGITYAEIQIFDIS